MNHTRRSEVPWLENKQDQIELPIDNQEERKGDAYQQDLHTDFCLEYKTVFIQ
jgi:hypothetical protein